MGGAAMESVQRACAEGRCERAIELLEEALREQSLGFGLHYALGRCYGGGCRTHSLTDPDMASAYLRRSLDLLGDERGLSRAATLDELGNTLVRSRGAPRDEALRRAIECHREAAEIYARLGNRQEWARTQFNLGNSSCELSETTGEDHWREAVSHYEDSLRVRTREADPEGHAASLENLGTAYRRLSGADVRKCIGCFRKALHVYTAAAYPGKCAAVESNLGNVFLSLPAADAGSSDRNARRALRHFDRALGLQTRDTATRGYAVTQYNRAQAYLRLARAAPVPHLSIAAQCLEEAFATFETCGEHRYSQIIRDQLKEIREQ
jgi:tetratricopeptide (TPR) repeat protein